MLQGNQEFVEVRVFEGVAERTGNTVGRDSVRRSKSVCQSMSELARKVRRDGDGLFYVPSSAWPQDTAQVNLIEKWTPIS